MCVHTHASEHTLTTIGLYTCEYTCPLNPGESVGCSGVGLRSSWKLRMLVTEAESSARGAVIVLKH